jgi:5-methyltetrahydrofolate--homocysteine methyltransferase
VVALTCDKDGIPTDPQKKFEIAESLIKSAEKYGISHDRIFIDPLVTTLATTSSALTSFVETVKKIRAAYPDVHITSGLSNISFGMPLRKSINMQFLALTMAAGMDSAIMDPTSEDMRVTMYATDALMENDRSGLKFLKAYKKGLIGNKK